MFHLLGRIVLAASLLPTSANAASSRLLIYSDLCTEQQSGDIAGHQVSIRWFGRTPIVMYRWTEGAIEQPVQANTVIYNPGNGRLDFEAATFSGPASFRGRVNSAALSGKLREGWSTTYTYVYLARVRSAAASPPACKQKPVHPAF